MSNPRRFIDLNGGYQSAMTDVDKLAHDAWVKKNSWGLTKDDFIRLSYFKGNLEYGSDGITPQDFYISDALGDVVYMNGDRVLTRAMVIDWYTNYCSFAHGYRTAYNELQTKQD